MSILGFVLFVGFILWSNYEMGVAVAKARKEEAAAKDALQAQQQLFRDQQDARTALHEAKHAAEQKNWEQTVAAGRRAWEHTEKHGNHEEFVALATEAKQLIERGEERIRIGQNLQQFHELRDLVRTYGTPFSGLDLKSKIELSRKEIHRAIALFGLNPETKSTLNLQGGFTPEEKEEIAAGSFELLLILSDIEAQPLSGETREEHIDKARKALDLLNLAEKIHPTCVSFGMRKARLQKQFGDDSAAVRTLSEAIQKQPETAFDFFLLGEDRFHLGDLKTAQASLYEALQREPNHFWTQFYLSLCALQLNAPAEARTYLNSCLAQKPKFVGLYTLRGLAQTALKSYAHAAEDYQQALDLKPSETIRYGILVNRALMHFDLNETDAAVTDLNAAIRIKPDQYQAYVNLARVYERVDLPKAMNAIDSAIEREPRMGALYRLRAQYQVKLKNVPEAIKDYDLAIAKEPALSPNRIGDQLEKAKLLYRQKQYQEAVTICNEALTGENEATAKKSQRIRLHTLRSEALIELRRFAEAVESYDRAERLGWDPDAEGYRFRGLARGKMGRHSEAIADLSMSVEKNPLPEVFAERGWIYLVSSAPKLALWDFEESIRRKPSADAFSGRGFARVVLGQLPEAIADVKESLSQGSETPRLLFNASRITAQVGAKTPVPEKGKPGSATATEARQKLFDQSLEYLKKSLEALPSEKRASFWRDVVKPDEAMNPLRNQPGFAKLEQMYASPNTGR
jgi:tetratricopeptide (TPR) repeat protein